MKRITLSFLFAGFLFGLIACSNNNEKASNNNQNVVNNNEQANQIVKKGDVREIVWKQLSLEQRELIDGTWKDGKVSNITMTENMMTLVDNKSYEGKEVYLIDFPTKSESIPNNMIVYADKDTFDYIGNGLVD